MMFIVIRCNQCKEQGSMDVSISFRHAADVCGSCQNIRERKWDYYFCNRNCLLKWLIDNKIEQRGFPCNDCKNLKDNNKPTGWAYGFKVNGVCKTCNGTKRVK